MLFVNVSIGGTLTHFAAPPVLMVARTWNWDTAFMIGHFGWRTVLAIALSTGVYYLFFRRELAALADRPPAPDVDLPEDETTGLLPVPVWVTLMHMAFVAWSVVTSHYPALFVGGFLFFLGFARATSSIAGLISAAITRPVRVIRLASTRATVPGPAAMSSAVQPMGGARRSIRS